MLAREVVHLVCARRVHSVFVRLGRASGQLALMFACNESRLHEGLRKRHVLPAWLRYQNQGIQN